MLLPKLIPFLATFTAANTLAAFFSSLAQRSKNLHQKPHPYQISWVLTGPLFRQ